jgi:small nuclear ribonucleoprotein B and B'
MGVSKTNRFLNYIDHRIRVTTSDGRNLVGRFLAFDNHMNMVLADCEEFRQFSAKKSRSGKAKAAKLESSKTAEQKRTLGLIILRGEIVTSISVESPPPSDSHGQRIPASAQLAASMNIGMGPGIARPAGRGIAAPPPGIPAAMAPPTFPQMGAPLSGPVRGVGPGNLMPNVYGRPAPSLGLPPRPSPPGMAPPHFPPGMVPPPFPPGMAPPGMMPPVPPMFRPGFRPGPPPPFPPGMMPPHFPPGMTPPPFPPGMMPPPPPPSATRPRPPPFPPQRNP